MSERPFLSQSSTFAVYPADSAAYQYFGEFVSPIFEAMNDGQRQRLVWDRILALLDYRDQERVEFVYTNAPSEYWISPPSPRPRRLPRQLLR